MFHRLILKFTKFQRPPPKRLSTVVKKIWKMPQFFHNRLKISHQEVSIKSPCKGQMLTDFQKKVTKIPSK